MFGPSWFLRSPPLVGTPVKRRWPLARTFFDLPRNFSGPPPSGKAPFAKILLHFLRRYPQSDLSAMVLVPPPCTLTTFLAISFKRGPLVFLEVFFLIFPLDYLSECCRVCSEKEVIAFCGRFSLFSSPPSSSGTRDYSLDVTKRKAPQLLRSPLSPTSLFPFLPRLPSPRPESISLCNDRVSIDA